jgi:hypothetical protein
MKQAILIAAITAALIAALGAAPASAQNSRTFVSGGGFDTNSCSRTAPCRTFGAAIALTNAGGEIVVLSSAGYGPFTIGKSITVTAIGVEAAITATTTDGITISAGPSDVVTLRGLTLTQTGNTGGLDGIIFNSGGTLNIQNCVVRGFSRDGIRLPTTTPSTINVADTIVSGNGQQGINLGPVASTSAFYERVQSVGNRNRGLLVSDQNTTAGATIKVIVANSIVSNNGGFGLDEISLSANPPVVMIVNSEFLNNFAGIETDTNGTVFVANSKIYGNSNFGFLITGGGAIKTFGNNYFANNGGNTGSLTPIAQQ